MWQVAQVALALVFIVTRSVMSESSVHTHHLLLLFHLLFTTHNFTLTVVTNCLPIFLTPRKMISMTRRQATEECI